MRRPREWAGAAAGRQRARQPEVEELHHQLPPFGPRLLTDQYVLGLNIAMDNALLMYVMEGIGDLENDVARNTNVEAGFAVEHLGERFTLDELHDHERANL